MLTDDLRKLYIQQIGSELTAHQQYLAISIWFDQQGLQRRAKLFRHRSVEEEAGVRTRASRPFD